MNTPKDTKRKQTSRAESAKGAQTEPDEKAEYVPRSRIRGTELTVFGLLAGSGEKSKVLRESGAEYGRPDEDRVAHSVPLSSPLHAWRSSHETSTPLFVSFITFYSISPRLRLFGVLPLSISP